MKSTYFYSVLAGSTIFLGLATGLGCDSRKACLELQDLLPGQIAFKPGGTSTSPISNASTLYEDTRTSYADYANEDDFPACMVYPSSAEDVSIIVQVLQKYRSVAFALKSGGRNWNRGFSSSDGGILISFRPNMQTITPSADLQTVDVGPGCRWREVMAALNPLGRAAVGGRAADVGVGGFIPLGGLSYLTAQYGFASDNVVEFEVVLSNGTIVVASEDSYSDLFFALRGGSNNFGIITKYTLQTHPVGTVWGGPLIYTSDQAHAVVSAITKYVSTFNKSKSALLPTITWSSTAQFNGSYIWAVFLFWDGSIPPSALFQDFFDIPMVYNGAKAQTYPEILELGGLSTSGGRTTDAVTSLPNLAVEDMTTYLEWYVTQAQNASFRQNLAANVTAFSMAIQPIPVGLQKANAVRGPAALQMDPSVGDKIWIEHTLTWQNEGADSVIAEQLASFVEQTTNYQKAQYSGFIPTNNQGGDLTFGPYNPIFANDAQSGQDPLFSYGPATFQHLQDIRAEYDPSGFMYRTNGFKLPKVWMIGE